ncbi:hypothetical protein EFY79_10310 [Hanamia caeni]|jgi:hypothetical protein|uniref:Uncharacterized protein n=1 Tax=Hanamia caeni TaxID=2294116 RepID=A0A3M9NG04_9BACT|nr:hypothetical protein [Hanamia caeni]RNI36710.1 hypothetical protein EFY79_10310 [Hanamia caeni]
MSLDTVLKIGKALRNAPDNLKYFKYVSPCPTDKDGNYPFCISVPVLEDFSFDWNNIKETPENARNKLYYLRFKTSDSDGLMKYIFGDIYYSTTATIKKDGSVETAEGGGYRLESKNAKPPYNKSSFDRGAEDFESIIKNIDKEKFVLLKFRNAFSKDQTIIETILGKISAVKYYLENPSKKDFLSFIKDDAFIKEYTIKELLQKTSKATLKKLGISEAELDEEKRKKLLEYDNGEIFIQFEFPKNKQWYDYKEELAQINEKMFLDFVDKSDNGFVLKKTLYKTLCSGDKKNDIQFPGFDLAAKFKSKSFSNEEIQDLFYAIDFSKKGKFIPGTNIKIIVLPHGNNLTADNYVEFQQKGDEERIVDENENNSENEGEPLFDIFEKSDIENITSFDVIFSKKGERTEVDLSEISGIEKSKIRATIQRIRNRGLNIFPKGKQFKLEWSLTNIMGKAIFDEKEKRVKFVNRTKTGSGLKPVPSYQSHFLKILPLIYTDNYHFDGTLFPHFIQNVEFSIRAGDPKFNFLKFDLEFLLSIQNNQNNRYMDITNSASYQIGNLLGSLAKNFSGDKSPIKSFEKNFVGNLSRRISTINDFVKLKNDIEQKLIMHEKTKFTYQTSYELSQKVKDFKGVYDREESAFGFFEAYFKPIPKKEITNSEN